MIKRISILVLVLIYLLPLIYSGEDVFTFSTFLNKPDSLSKQAEYLSGNILQWNYRLNNQGPSFNANACFFIRPRTNNILYDITELILRIVNKQKGCTDENNNPTQSAPSYCPIRLDNRLISKSDQEETGNILRHVFTPTSLPSGEYELIAQLRDSTIGCSNPSSIPGSIISENVISAIPIATSSNYFVYSSRTTGRITPQDCLQIDSINNDLSDRNRINLVVVGINYVSLEDLDEVAKSITGLNDEEKGLFSVEPFKSNRNKFNLLLVGDIRNTQIDTFPVGSPEEFNFKEGLANVVRSAGLKCPYQNKRIVGLINNEPTTNLLDFAYPNELGIFTIPYRSNIVLNDLENYNILHEIGGHTITGLYDEYQWQIWLPGPEDMVDVPWKDQCFYVDRRELSCRFEYGGYSCDTPPQTVIDRCNREAPWHDLVGNECGQEGIVDCDRNNPNNGFEIKCTFGGCSPNSFVASRANIMGIPSGQRQYSKYHQRLICKKIKEITGSVGGICNNLCINGCRNGQKCINGVCQIV